MKTLLNLSLFFVLVFALENCYAQNEQMFLDNIMQKHINEFKSDLNLKEENVYVILRYDFTDYKIDKVKFVEPTLDAKYLLGQNNYLVQFTLKNNMLTAVNFKIVNKSKKKLELINMMNGKDYRICDYSNK